MKNFAVFTAAAAVVSLVSCGPSAEEIAKQQEQARQDSIAAAASAEHSYTLDVAASNLNWSGTALVKTHTGTMKFVSGSFTTKGPLLQSGEFVVDMKGDYMMNDTFYTKDATKDMLMGHLKSPAFFNVDSFPTAGLKINTVTGNTATCDLTVRGITHPETITDIAITPNADGTVKATGKLVFDRKKYNANWDYPAGDVVLSNDITLMVDLVGKAQ